MLSVTRESRVVINANRAMTMRSFVQDAIMAIICRRKKAPASIVWNTITSVIGATLRFAKIVATVGPYG